MSDTSDRLMHLLEKQTGRTFEQFDENSTLEEVGIDSFDFIEFLFLVEDEFGIDVNYRANDFSKRVRSLGDVVALIEGLVAAPRAGGGMVPAQA